MKQILLVEPDRVKAEVYQLTLQKYYDVYWARTSQGAVKALDSRHYDAVITEANLDLHSGVELLHEIRSYEDWLDIPVLILSALPKERFPLNVGDWEKLKVTYLSKSAHRSSSLLAVLDGLLNAKT